jgi:maleate isomerase
MRAMAPTDVGIHGARAAFGAMAAGGAMDPTIPLAPVRAFAESAEVERAVELLAAAPLDAIAYGFTSSAYVVGPAGEQAMLERLQKVAGAIPVVATGDAFVRAVQRLGVERPALFSPPWFDTELNALGRAYFEEAGFEVVAAASCELPSGQTLVTPAALFDWVRAHTPASADVVVIGGNGLRAVGVIDALEQTLGLPVLTANQALLWAALEAARDRRASSVQGYGAIFSSGSSGG